MKKRLISCLALAMTAVMAQEKVPPIDRHARVTRHDVVLTNADVHSPLSVGNGEFAFTADATGLQTFEKSYLETIPLSTLSQWGFHTMPSRQGFSLEKFPLTTIDTSGNGGLLYAVTLMAAGWSDAPAGNAPGFPTDGSWSVKWEGLQKAP
ncbi:MAG: hypothetical protein WCP35_09300 [Verrucomicrobiota bacterium]